MLIQPAVECRRCKKEKPRDREHFRWIRPPHGPRMLSSTCRSCEQRRLRAGLQRMVDARLRDRTANGIQCLICGERKPATTTNFAVDPKSGNLRAPCRPCKRRAIAAMRDTQEGRMRRRAYSRSARGRACNRRYRARRRALGPVSHSTLAYKAYSALNYALLIGRVVRASVCSACRARCKPIAFYRSGYTRPVEIEWLCRSCHRCATTSAARAMGFDDWLSLRREELAEERRLKRTAKRKGVEPDALAGLEALMTERVKGGADAA